MKQVPYIEWLSRYMMMVVFVFCVFPHWTTLAIIGLLFMVVYGYTQKELRFKWNRLATWTVAIYGAYLLGMVWTENTAMGTKYLEYKMSLLAFPFLLSFRPRGRLDIILPIWGWIFGVMTASIIGVVTAIFCYMDEGSYMCFFSGTISPIHHPTYFSAFHTLALAFMWWAYRNHAKGFKLTWMIPYTIFSTIYMALSLSQASLLFLILCAIVLTANWIWRKWGKLAFAAAVIVLPLSGWLILTYTPILEGEWNASMKHLKSYVKDPEAFIKNTEEPLSGNETRLVLWTASSQEIIENPWGVGTGDLDIHLEERLNGLGQETLAKKHYNPHNQFLQTGLELGLPGLILLCVWIFVIVRISYKEKNILLLLLVANLIFNCLFESMLQRQSGIVFYTFWICFLSYFFIQDKKEKHDERLSASSRG